MTIAETASTSLVRKGAVVLCFALLAAAYFVIDKSSAADSIPDDDDNSDDRQSLPARLAWTVWMAIAAAACFAIGQLAGTLTPALQLPFRGLGAVLMIVAAHKLFFGRRSNNTDIDL